MSKYSSIIIFIIISGFVFSGMLSDTYLIYGINIFDIFLLILFSLLIFASILFIGKVRYTKLDIYFLLLYLFTIGLPVLVNMDVILYDIGDIRVILLPIKIYILYRVLFEIENLFSAKINEKSCLDYVIILSSIAAIFGLLRFLDIPFFTEFINTTWPIDQGRGTDPVEYGRLVSTMSGTNGGASYFSMISILSLFQYIYFNKKIYLYTYLFFLLIIFLTGSLTAIILIFFLSIFLIKKYFSFVVSTRLILGAITLFALIYFSGHFQNQIISVYEVRIEDKLLEDRETIAPRNLQGRYERWGGQIEVALEQPIFGYAVRNSLTNIPSITITHNYYVFLLLYSGIIGLVCYLIFNISILKNLYTKNSDNYMIYIIIFMLIAQFTQLTNHYSGISGLLGLLFFLNKERI